MCTLESPGELLKIPMQRPHPRPIKPDSLGKGRRRQYFLKLPGWWWFQGAAESPGESPCLGEKGSDHRFTADETGTHIRLRAPTSYPRPLKIQSPSYAGTRPSCPSFPGFLPPSPVWRILLETMQNEIILCVCVCVCVWEVVSFIFKNIFNVFCFFH